jgi:putative oxidoreductase
MNTAKIAHRALRIIPAFIMGQTLFFKFTAHPESVSLFTKLWMEPTGRLWIGILELIACLLLIFWGKRHRIGAVLGCWLMVGAIYFHLTVLGIDPLFWMAVITLICCAIIVWNNRNTIKTLVWMK